MPRVCFTLQVADDAIDEYRAHHREVWPEMRQALTRAGWRNYSLFLRGDGLLIGYVETEGSFDEALAAMASEPVNERWQALMAPFFAGSGANPDEQMVALDEIFHLP